MDVCASIVIRLEACDVSVELGSIISWISKRQSKGGRESEEENCAAGTHMGAWRKV